MRRSNRKGRLVVVGLGFRPATDVTLESLRHLTAADKVLFVGTHQLMSTWIRSLNTNAESLEGLYAAGKPRIQTYREMSERVVREVETGSYVCAAFYGHPGVLAQATHWAIATLRERGYRATMLPGISAEDCLFADLGINPGDTGCQTYEATDFLIRRISVDPKAALVLYQVGVLGEASVPTRRAAKRQRLLALADRLLKRYPAEHPVLLYKAPVVPGQSATVKRTSVRAIPKQRIDPMMTVYIPPVAASRSARRDVSWLRRQV